MAFKAGAVVGEARLDTKKWTKGTNVISGTSKKLMGVMGPLIGVAGFAGVALALGKAIGKGTKAVINIPIKNK